MENLKDFPFDFGEYFQTQCSKQCVQIEQINNLYMNLTAMIHRGE